MSQSTPPPSAVRRLPVGETVVMAYGAVFGRLNLVFKAAVLPFILSIVIASLALLTHKNNFLTFVLVVMNRPSASEDASSPRTSRAMPLVS